MVRGAIRGETGRRVALAIAVGCAALLMCAARADARLAYTPAQPLSDASDQDVYSPQVAVGPSGTAIVTWQRDGQLYFARIAADGSPEPAQALGSGEQYGGSLVIDQDGAATVVWQRYTDVGAFIESARIGPDGVPSPVRTVAGPANTFSSPSVALDADGLATVAWTEYDYSGPEKRTIGISRLDADGVPAPPITVSEYGGPGSPKMAIAPSGRMMVVWSREQRLLATFVAPDGTPGKLVTLVEGGYYPAADVVADGAGSFFVGWAERYPEDLIRLAEFSADGSAGPRYSLDGLGTAAPRTPDLLVDRDDRVSLVWADCTGGDCGGRFGSPILRVFSSKFDPGAGLKPAALLSGPVDSFPAAAIDETGTITAVWARARSEGIGAVTIEPDGTPGPVLPASRPSIAETYRPSVAVDPLGTATIVWIHGTNNRIEFSRSYSDSRLLGSVSAKRRQRQAPDKTRIEVLVRAGEPLVFNARGRIAMKGRDYSIRLKRLRLPEGRTTVSLRPNWRDHRIAQRIQRGEKATARLDLRIRDHAGNAREKQLDVRLLPS